MLQLRGRIVTAVLLCMLASPVVAQADSPPPLPGQSVQTNAGSDVWVALLVAAVLVAVIVAAALLGLRHISRRTAARQAGQSDDPPVSRPEDRAS
jgi:glycerol uptake facilitator-like aquaporin